MTMTLNVNAAMAKGSKWAGNIIAGSVPSNYLTGASSPDNICDIASFEFK